MRRPVGFSVLVAALGALVLAGPAAAQVVELQGAWLIDGYTFQPGDRSPRGTVAYDADANSFRGTYKDKGTFTFPLPAGVKDGQFTPYEVVAFSAEAAGATPSFPSGSKIQAAQRPAFYLYAPLPGSNIPSVYCGHGQDFSFTSNQEHTCFD